MGNSQRVILTGATGLIGRKLFVALRERGYELVIFSRNPATARSRLPGAAEYVAWQPAETGAWAAAVDGAYAIINLAGAPISQGVIGPRWTPAYKEEIRSSRVLGTRGLVNAIAAATQRPTVLVNASSIGFYGYYNDEILDEETPAGNDFVAEVCVAWEREAARAQEFGVRVAMIRTGIVLDPDGGALGQIMLPFRLRAGGPIMPGTQYYSWIHPSDEVGLFCFALENQQVTGPLNGTAPTPEMNRDFTNILGKVLGSPSWLAVPELSLRLTLGEMADLVVKGQRALPRRAQALGYQFRFHELRPALEDLLR
ncbi:TIGR01777 family oxidoreductase [Candidatus Viridilinea mediisalina]|uniref:TIGR01777 family protein n=1 Tax=Candidatus Viridilinea mediisalina TaxID=2024553 RepID=A0A2A6RNJ1_9CHLR|nr:TIGR01777 family oxidoreductase [Candidatus Viridilinea mediisalina]PDW04513.1 TIGR01777 family protein [Candidatus Viridilinea mediisalina]